MSVVTVAVTFTAYDQQGDPVAGAVLTARLNQTEIYNGLIVPEVYKATADANGVAVLNLWPNALGVNGSMYQIKATNPDTGKKFLDVLVSVPNSACNLHQIITAEPYPAIDASAQALAAAQGAQALATAQADIATVKAGEADASAVAASGSASAAATSALAASISEGNADASEAAAAASALDIHTNWQDKLDAADAQATVATDQAVIATAQAVISTTQASTSTTQAGTATAARIAAEAARDAAVISSKVYTTTALGVAGTTNGQYFGVIQTYGDAVDIYQNSAGTAVATGKTSPFYQGNDASIRSSAIDLDVIQEPVTPFFTFSPVEGVDHNGKWYTNKYSPNVSEDLNFHFNWAGGKDRTLYADPRGELTGFLSTFANAGSILRIVDQAIYGPQSSGKSPGGNFVIKAAFKSAPGAGTQTIYVGDYNDGGLAAYTIDEASWTYVTKAYTGKAEGWYPNFWVWNQSLTSYPVNFITADIQAYQGASVPAFTGESTKRNLRGFWLETGKFTKDRWAINSPRGYFKAPDYPKKTTFTELTSIVAVKYAVGDNYPIFTALGGSGGPDILNSFGLGAMDGALYAGGVLPYGSNSNYFFESDKGYEIVAIRCKAGARSAFTDNIEYVTDSGTFTGMSASHFVVGQSSGADVGFRFYGSIAGITIFDKWLTNDQMATAISNMKKRVAGAGNPMLTFNNMFLLEGDSITESMCSMISPKLPKKFSPIMKTRVYASGGAALPTLNARLPETVRLIQSIVASGRRAIFFVSIGTNAIPTTADLAIYWAAIRAAGAKLIVATLIPRDGTNSPTRDAYNAWIRANPSLYDGLADFQANPLIGPDAASLNTTYYNADKVHLNAAGYEIMFGILKTVVDGLRLPE